VKAAQAGMKPSAGSCVLLPAGILPASSSFIGMIDDVCIYNAALSAEQIAALTR